jgi:hypothetical protein
MKIANPIYGRAICFVLPLTFLWARECQSSRYCYNFRISLTDYFKSRGAYYRSKDGERLLNATQQQKIRSVLQRYLLSETCPLPFGSW